MAFSILAFDSSNNSAGSFAKVNSLAEASSVTSSLVLKLMIQLTRTAKGSFFFAITVTLGVRNFLTAFLSFFNPSTMLNSLPFSNISP